MHLTRPMTAAQESQDIERRLGLAREFDRLGQLQQAEQIYAQIFAARAHPAVATRLAQIAMGRGDRGRAVQVLDRAVALNPDDGQLAIELAVIHAHDNDLATAIAVMASAVERLPDFYTGWLLLGNLRDTHGDARAALRAWYQAVVRAKNEGMWNSANTTPPDILDSVVHAIEQVRSHRRDIYFDSYDDLRVQHGAAALKRVDRALSGHLREWDATPPDPRQRPKFLFFPDIPCLPYHDPFLQPWAKQLQDAYPILRADAVRVLEEDQQLPNFINFKEGGRKENVLTGNGPRPSWEALFFYRHGKRYDVNHRRCPKTSEVLESIELCRIANEAPEILFSVLTPGTHIQPHYGVTNTRLVMHLPLVVPPNCALNVIGAGEHHWKEGELMMFDDTFEHEAWNRSDQTRIILLMDCWNPHLTPIEKVAVKQMIETISGLHLCEKPRETDSG